MQNSPHTAILRYELAPGQAAREALDETIAAYATMFSMLREEITTGKAGANLVTLHDLAYEAVRTRTRLPARLVTLGLRDFASSLGHKPVVDRLPLDEKLFTIKGPAVLTIATVRGRVSIPYDVIGYSNGQLEVFNAQLLAQNGRYEILIGVTPHSHRTEGNIMMNESILSRMGRLIAGLANNAVDKAEGSNKIVVVEQALREIAEAAQEARNDIGKARAEEFRILSRRKEIAADIQALDEKIKGAMDAGRDDLAKAGVARQIDLESQLSALDKAMDDVSSQIEDGQQALQAVLATQREAGARLAELKSSASRIIEETGASQGKPGALAAANRAAAAISRVTSVPGSNSSAGAELDELDRLHRERAIEARLNAFKANRN